MTIRLHCALLMLLPLVTAIGCDVQEEEPLIDEDLEMRLIATPIGGLGFEPYHGRWEGPMTQVNGITNNDYDATIVLAPGLCTVLGTDILRAEWDYYNLGLTCTSELDLLGVGVAPDGTRTWTFYDSNVSGPCSDGLVDLTETADPTIMEHTWRDLTGTVDAEGLVNRVGLCSWGAN